MKPIRATRAGNNLRRLLSDDAAVDLDDVRRLIPHCKPAELAESLIAAADQGHVDAVSELAKAIRPGSSHVTALGNAAKAGSMGVLRALLPFVKALTGTHDRYLFTGGSIMNLTARAGRLEAVRELISASEWLPYYTGEALCWAAIGGHLEVVQELLSHREPESDFSAALREAARCGHLDIVRTLIPLGDPKADNSKALREAAGRGHLEITRLLIPISDPKVNKSEALRNAVADGHRDVARLLIPVSDVDEAINYELKKVLSFRSSEEVAGALRVFDVLTFVTDETTSRGAFISLLDGLFAYMPLNGSRYHRYKSVINYSDDDDAWERRAFQLWDQYCRRS